MCGIAGFAPKPDRPFLDAGTLQRMTGLLAHRGPDAETFMIDQGFGLGHRRLSIIDVEGGDNPLEDTDGAVSLVFNGEIYNHLELRAELEARGARPRTRSDGEAIVHGYLAFGLDGMLARLRGMFAFALLDRRDRTLHLARDPFGIKPLYHSTTKDALVFGSEIKAITGALPGPWDLSRRGLLQSACLGFTLAPETIFERVQSLPPGHVATWRNGRFSIKPYHALTFAPDREPREPGRALAAVSRDGRASSNERGAARRFSFWRYRFRCGGRRDGRDLQSADRRGHGRHGVARHGRARSCTHDRKCARQH